MRALPLEVHALYSVTRRDPLAIDEIELL